MTRQSELLGQGAFCYRADRHWGRLDENHYPVKDCHGIAEDRAGRIVLLTNSPRNNLIAYEKTGILVRAWETRFPGAHGLMISGLNGDERYWITDHDRKVVVALGADGDEIVSIGPDAVSSIYGNGRRYMPTNVAVIDDAIFVSDGYGSSFIHRFDPEGRYVASFGGEGSAPENLRRPHAVWIDQRSDAPSLLVCDRGNSLLKWFTLAGELVRVVPVPGALPCNVASLRRSNSGCLAIACLTGMVLILNEADQVVSVVGGAPPEYDDGVLKPLRSFNYDFNHPHDVHVDDTGALYVAQWWSNQTYPIKLNPAESPVASS